MVSNSLKFPDFNPPDIWKAKKFLKPYIFHTPILYSPNLSRRTGCHVYLKMECWQIQGCFKVRGAIFKVSQLSEEQRQNGLLTCSSGNHGTALAYAASLFGKPPTKVFLPTNAEPAKVSKISNLGAETVFHGKDYLEALQGALSYLETNGGTYVHSHGDPLVIAGQGTIGLEIMEDLPDVEAVIVPVGGGGLMAGIATSIKALAPQVRLFGVEAAAAPGAYLSFKDGFCHETVAIKPSVADGLMGTLTPLTFDITYPLVESIQVMSEPEIIYAMQILQKDDQIMVEGSAAVGIAALLSGKQDLQGKKVIVVLTGRNINADQFNKLMTNPINPLAQGEYQ